MVRTLSSTPETLKRILAECGVQRTLTEIEAAQKETEDQITPEDYMLPSEEFWNKWNLGILERLKVQGNLQHIARAIGDNWWYFAELETYPETKEILDYLKQNQFKIGLVTNGFKSDIDEILPKFGLTGYFDVAVGVDAVGKPKPNEEIFLFALNKLNVHPNESLFVGDSLESDYEGAKKAGLTAVLIDRTGKVKCGIRTMRDLTELKLLLQ